MENCSFPCIGAWDGFHVHVATRLKVSILSSISITVVTWIQSDIPNVSFMLVDARLLCLKCLVKYNRKGQICSNILIQERGGEKSHKQLFINNYRRHNIPSICLTVEGFPREKRFKCEPKMHNVKYVFMAHVLLNNLCIVIQDPCNSRWKSHVDELSLVERNIPRTENKGH